MCLLQSGGGGRDCPARHVTSTSRAKEESARVARARLTSSPTQRVAFSNHSYHPPCEARSADARYRANKKDFTGFLVLGVIRKVLPTASRMSTTAARCRAVMTSQDTTSRFPTAALLASRDVVQPLKATNVARGDYDSQPAAQQRHPPAQPFPRGFIGGVSKPSADGRPRRQADRFSI